MLAREFGENKHKTLVLERKKNLLDFSFKTLGSFINLKEFKLSDNVIAQRIDSIAIHSEKFKNNLSTKEIELFNKDIGAYILDKVELHKELLSSLNTKYVEVVTDINIVDIKKNDQDNYSYIIDKQGVKYRGKIFVDASGTAGTLSKKINLQIKKPKLATGLEYNAIYKGNPQQAHLFIGKTYKGGYGWIFPLKNNRAIVGFGTFDKQKITSLKKSFYEILETPKIKNLVQLDNKVAEGGSIPLTPVLDKFIDNNLVCVGDSVSQVNPIVGEGYKFIFESALMASKAINNYLKTNNLKDLKLYEDTWRKRFYSNYLRSKKKQKLLIKFSKNDFLIDMATLALKFRSEERNLKSLSGEYQLKVGN